MKKLGSILLALAMLTGCSSDRSEILKVYNWSCYLDEALIGEFEDWYQEQTGEKVKVIYQTFDVNETMLSKIELGHEDYDVVCPSDYIIERMLSADLLMPINRNFGDTPDYLDCISPFIKSYFDQIDGHGKNANDYSVAFMWGTSGLLYNPKYVSDEDVTTWECLRNPKFAGNILMKDAFRDVYTSLMVAFNKEAIEAGEKTVNDVCRDASDESVSMVEDWLTSFSSNVAGWEADFGKDQMVSERAWLSFNWSGDAQWAIEEAANSGLELRFHIPEDGSTIWFDGWVIPKYAKNVKAASYWINFMCKPENAIRNMAEVGYVSAVGGSEVLEAQSDPDLYEPSDVSYFFGEEATSACVSPVQYPAKEFVSSCGMLHDSGANTEKLLAMWSRVKGDSATNWTVIIIITTIVVAGIVAVVNKSRKNHRRAKARKKK